MKRRRYSVGIRKDYFPKAIWPNRITAYQHVWSVLATSRTEAAHKAWSDHGVLLLSEMTPDATISGRRISFDVNDPEKRVALGRLEPILVHSQQPVGKLANIEKMSEAELFERVDRAILEAMKNAMTDMVFVPLSLARLDLQELTNRLKERTKTSVDATEARLAIAPKGEVVSVMEGGVRGFSIRNDGETPNECARRIVAEFDRLGDADLSTADRQWLLRTIAELKRGNT